MYQVSTLKLRLLSALCLLFCVPAAIYGFSCHSAFKKADDEATARQWLAKGEKGCAIGLAIGGALWLASLLLS